ncbi:MAG TPA: hypothetical protein ENI23_10510 [bacterium]|nr:hypothetical protein [bacterium]
MTSNSDRKVYRFGEQAQNKISEGLRKGAEIVGSTLGSCGQNVLIGRKHRTPIITNDGLTVINNLILEDELENEGVLSLVDAANHASELVGDGSSTTIILAQAIYEAGKKLIGGAFALNTKSSMQVKREIHEATKLVIQELKKSSKGIKTKEEIKSVAFAACEDEEMAEIISDLVIKVGENGTIIVEEGWGRESEVELVSGMRFAAKVAHDAFQNTAERDLLVENIPILVTDFDFVGMDDVLKIYTENAKAGEQGLVIVANKYELPAISTIVSANLMNAKRGSSHRVHLVRTPSFTPGEFEDFATYVGATYFSKERGDKLGEAQLTDLGRCSSLRVSRNGDGVALGGGGSKESRDERIETLKKELKSQPVKQIKGRLEQRIASLAAAIGIIKVASPSDAETEYIRLKTRNGVKSAQAAVSEGVVIGGGKALKDVAKKIGKDNILYEAIQKPYDKIQENAGGKLEIPKDLFDPLKVTRTALEQASSQAGLLLTTLTAIAFRSERDFGDGAKVIADKIK